MGELFKLNFISLQLGGKSLTAPSPNDGISIALN